MSWNVLITARTADEVGAPAIELLRQSGCSAARAPQFGALKADELRPVLKDVDAVLASADQYSQAVLTSPEAARLKIISRWGVGYDSIDIAAATGQGIVVAYTPGLLSEAVADYTMALLLNLARRVHLVDAAVREGRWKPIWGKDVSGKTIGIVGCGRIGQAVARRASGFNLRVLGCDVAPSPQAEQLGVRFVSLEALLSESDFVSLHAASTPENLGLIGSSQLRRMKPTAYLINTARGALVDETALVQALREGWIAGAALDTFVQEPLPAEHPFRHIPNLLLSPHQASFGYETGVRVSVCAAQAIVDLMQGRRPQYVVNPEVFQAPALRAALR